jgi:hypothetical protein
VSASSARRFSSGAHQPILALTSGLLAPARSARASESGRQELSRLSPQLFSFLGVVRQPRGAQVRRGLLAPARLLGPLVVRRRIRRRLPLAVRKVPLWRSVHLAISYGASSFVKTEYEGCAKKVAAPTRRGPPHHISQIGREHDFGVTDASATRAAIVSINQEYVTERRLSRTIEGD